MAREVHEALARYEAVQGDGAVAVASRELADAARKIWSAPTWPLQCFVSQRMRANWAYRDKSVSFMVPNPSSSSFKMSNLYNYAVGK